MIFVTGATGLLGSHLLVELSLKHDLIKAQYRSELKIKQTQELFKHYLKDNWSHHFNKIVWSEGDILDLPYLQTAMKDVTQVYHCAALVSFDPKDFNKLQKVNREGTANVVNIALSIPNIKLCHVSSTAALGGEENEIDETTTWKKTPKTTGYSISKYGAEKEVWRGIEEGLQAVIVNPCVILGAGNWNDSSLTIFRTIKKGTPFYPTGSNATVDARDVSSIMTSLMESEIHSEKYLCIGSNQSFKDLIQTIAKKLNVRSPKKPINRIWMEIIRTFLSFIHLFLPSRSSITKETLNSLYGNKQYDNSKVKNELSYQFRSLEDTISNAISGQIKS